MKTQPPVCLAIVICAAMTLWTGNSALAQDAGEQTGEAAQSEQSTPEPVLAGTASGTADGVPFSGAVDCSGFTAADLVQINSDPQGASEAVLNDGFDLSVTASRNLGTIDLSLKVSNTSYSFAGRLAQFTNNVMTYTVTLQSNSGPDIAITLRVDCPA